MCPVSQTIQHGSGHDRITEYLSPVGKAQVGSDYDGTSLISLSQNLKKQLAAFFGKERNQRKSEGNQEISRKSGTDHDCFLAANLDFEH